MAKHVTVVIRCDKCGTETNETGKMTFNNVEIYFCHKCAAGVLWCRLNDESSEKRRTFLHYYENRDGKP